MNFLESINNSRRILMRGITKNLGSTSPESQSILGINEIKRVLVCRPNHRLGNLLLITPLLQEVIATFPQCRIDLFVKGNLAQTLFKNYENINSIIQLPKNPFQHTIQYIQSWTSIKKQQYDMVINADRSSSSGRISVQLAHSKYKFFGDTVGAIQSKFKDYEHNAKYPIYNFRNYLAKLGHEQNDKPLPSLNLKLSLLEIAEGKKQLRELVHNESKTICLFTYATGKKRYPVSWWEDFYEKLKTEYPHFNIIEILPIQKVSQLSFKAPTFYSLDIRLIGALIANAEVFIGADSGIMHLASSVQTPTIGLFSVTDQKRYEPYNNNSVAINTNLNSTDECIQVLNSILVKPNFNISFMSAKIGRD